jgi:hypothetical protein
LTSRNLSVVPSSWIRKMGNNIVHESSMLSMKRRFANVLVNMNVNSSGNLDTYNLFAPDRNYTAMCTHVRWSVHLSALLITWVTWGDG